MSITRAQRPTSTTPARREEAKSKPKAQADRPRAKDAAPPAAEPRRVEDPRRREDARLRARHDVRANQLQYDLTRRFAGPPAQAPAAEAPVRPASSTRRPYSLESAPAASPRPAEDRVFLPLVMNGEPEAGASSALANRVFMPVIQAGAPAEQWRREADGSHTFVGTPGDDRYAVSTDAAGDMVVENLNSRATFRLPAADVPAGVHFELGNGNDRVTFDGSVTRAGMDVQGGNGADVLDASEIGAGASIHLVGGRGDDRLVAGTGADELEGGEGNDHLNGGDGDDRVEAGAGHDFVNGGAGADELDGGDGTDAIYADAADISVAASAAADGDVDVVVAENGAPATQGSDADDVRLDYDVATIDAWQAAHPDALTISGSAEFQARTKADLAVMLGTGDGRQLLDDLAASGESFFIGETTDRRASYNQWLNFVAQNEYSGRSIDPAGGAGAPLAPVSILAHELVHAHQDINAELHSNILTNPPRTEFQGGVLVNNQESAAVGLDYLDAPDAAHPDGVPVAVGARDIDDNEMRRQMGIPELVSYEGEDRPPVRHVPAGP